MAQVEKIRRGAKQAIVAHVYAETKRHEMGMVPALTAKDKHKSGGGGPWSLPSPSSGKGPLTALSGDVASAALHVSVAYKENTSYFTSVQFYSI